LTLLKMSNFEKKSKHVQTQRETTLLTEININIKDSHAMISCIRQNSAALLKTCVFSSFFRYDVE